jgi:glutamate dehydrogenase
MTGEVASLVLRNNYLQGQAISLLELHAREHLAEMGYVVRALERAGDLNRALEFLPTDEEFAERRKAGEGLTRPELAIVLCYGKIWLYKALINSDVPEDPYLSAELARYFPAPVQRRFAARLKRHRLRREIIATAITNSLINRMGPAFPVRAGEDTGADPAAIARAYSVAREIFEIRRLWSDIEALDDRVAPSVQYGAIGETSRLLRHVTYGLLTSKRGDLDIDRAVRRYRAKIAELTGNLTGLLGAGEKERVAARRAELIARRVPEKLAMRIASLGALHGALDVVDVSSATRSTVPFAAGVYFELGERIGLAWIRRQIESLAVDGHWQEVARRTLLDDLYDLHRRIARAALERRGKDPAARLTRWCRDQAPGVDALKRMEVEMRAGPGPDFATLSVALQMVRRLGEG